MDVQSLARGNATLFASTSGAAGKDDAADGASFAEFMQAAAGPEATNIDIKAKQRAIAKERIAEVGFTKYVEEQHEIQKMMRVLALFRDTAPADIREHLDTIIGDLEQNPPRHPQEMYARIEAYIDGLPKDELKSRLVELYAQIKEAMAKPDEELERLEKAERERRLRRSGNIFAIDPAIF